MSKKQSKAVPADVKSALFGVATSVELVVKVSDSSVKAYSFAFDGVPVPMRGGRGAFFAQPDEKKLLKWVMLGDPGATMKVTVTRDGKTVKERAKSTITPPLGKGFDALEIEVA